MNIYGCITKTACALLLHVKKMSIQEWQTIVFLKSGDQRCGTV